MIDQIQPLTQQQRIEARQKAVKAIEMLAGSKPQRSQFKNTTVIRYLDWITGIVVILSLVVLLTAFVLSAMRLYHIGYRTFYETLPDSLSSMIAGYAVVLLSEADRK